MFTPAEIILTILLSVMSAAFVEASLRARRWKRRVQGVLSVTCHNLTLPTHITSAHEYHLGSDPRNRYQSDSNWPDILID